MKWRGFGRSRSYSDTKSASSDSENKRPEHGRMASKDFIQLSRHPHIMTIFQSSGSSVGMLPMGRITACTRTRNGQYPPSTLEPFVVRKSGRFKDGSPSCFSHALTQTRTRVCKSLSVHCYQTRQEMERQPVAPQCVTDLSPLTCLPI